MTTPHRNARQQTVIGKSVAEREAQILFNELCKPLFQVFKIDYFRYIRYQRDKKVLVLSSDVKRDKLFFKHHEKSLRFVNSTQHYQEYYDFAAHGSSYSLQSISHTVPWVFRRFILYFREQAHDFINRGFWRSKETSKDLLKQLNLLKTPNNLSEAAQLAFIQQTHCRRYYLGGAYAGIYLTPKELEVMIWSARGKYTNEISVIVGSSMRTVEKHLTTVKWKLGAIRLTHAIRVLVEQKILEANPEYAY